MGICHVAGVPIGADREPPERNTAGKIRGLRKILEGSSLGADSQRHFVDQDPAISQDRRKGSLQRHLDVICRWRVESAVAADPNNGPAVGENDFRGLRRAPRRFRNRWMRRAPGCRRADWHGIG